MLAAVIAALGFCIKDQRLMQNIYVFFRPLKKMETISNVWNMLLSSNPFLWESHNCQINLMS